MKLLQKVNSVQCLSYSFNTLSILFNRQLQEHNCYSYSEIRNIKYTGLLYGAELIS